jgi:hypothetical protein
MGCCCNDLLLGDPVVAPVPDCEIGGTPPAITSFDFAIGGVSDCECGNVNQLYVCDTKVNECTWSPNLPFFICDSGFFDYPVFVRLNSLIGGTLYQAWVQAGISGGTPNLGNLTRGAQWGVTTTLNFFEPFTLPLVSTTGCATGWPSTITVVPVLP